jgi:hypothetical protein
MTRTLGAIMVAAQMLCGAPALAQHEHEHFDARHGHSRYYAPHGAEIGVLPHGAVEARFHGDRYWFHGGVWYRPYGPRWVVVAPPIGLYVSVLPPFYTTLMIGGAPYYYANETYYTLDPVTQQYVVVAPPAGAEAINPAGPAGPAGPADPAAPAAPEAPAAGSDQLYIYPRNGQSEEQLGRDKYECHRWAADQTAFDPTQPAGGVAPEQGPSRRAEYDRARSACLEARGYTVR